MELRYAQDLDIVFGNAAVNIFNILIRNIDPNDCEMDFIYSANKAYVAGEKLPNEIARKFNCYSLLPNEIVLTVDIENNHAKNLLKQACAAFDGAMKEYLGVKTLVSPTIATVNSTDCNTAIIMRFDKNLPQEITSGQREAILKLADRNFALLGKFCNRTPERAGREPDLAFVTHPKLINWVSSPDSRREKGGYFGLKDSDFNFGPGR